MKNLLIIFSVATLLFGCNKYNPENYLGKQQLQEKLVKVAVYTEQKPDDVSYDDRFKPEFKAFYKSVIDHLEISFHKFYKKDTLHYFLITKKAPKSLHGDFRGVGGVFKLSGDSISEMDIKFVTPMLQKAEMLEKSEKMFSAMVEKGSLNEFFGNPQYMEWPNPDVAYNNKTNRWYFPEGSRFSFYKDWMTNRE